MALTPIGRHQASPHLVELVAESERLAARCLAAPAERRAALGARRRDEAALASLRLDGSPLTEVPDPAVIADARATAEAVPTDDPERRGTWFDAMRAFEADPEAAEHDAALQALEFDGVARATADARAGEALLSDPIPALARLHTTLTADLVAPERAGQLRRVELAVHDAAVGRILYFTVDPDHLGGELAALGAWLVSSGTREHGLVVSGIAHLELLRLHPYDAANGRLARAASRALLRVRGLDPDGLAAPEPVLDGDRLGYAVEVARTIRRRDATVWLERWGEAVTEGLRRSARELGQLEVEVPARAEAFVATRPPGTDFTVADHRADAGIGPEESRADLRALLDAGRIARVPGSRGLRFTVR